MGVAVGVIGALSLACRRDVSLPKVTTTSAPAADDDPKRRPALLGALSAVESSAGDARVDARLKFFDARTGLDLATKPGDADLLPRFEALLRSRDDGDVELGVRLVEGVRHPSSLPGLWSIVKDGRRSSLLVGKALTAIAYGYRDPKLVPLLREMISRDEASPEAIRALRYYVSDPAVEQYLRQLIKDPRRVELASEVLRESGIAFDGKDAAVPIHRYSSWADGVSIEVPGDWSEAAPEGYSVAFRNSRLGALYGYRILTVPRAPKAARLRDDIERWEHLREELPPDGRAPTRSIWTATMASDVAAGRYSLVRNDEPIVRWLVVLVRGTRAVTVVGEAPKAAAAEFQALFDRMWPTIRIGTPDPEGAAALTKAVDDGIERAKRGRLFPAKE
jgi:hypothetical protein